VDGRMAALVILLHVLALGRLRRLDQQFAECALATLPATFGFVLLRLDDPIALHAGDRKCVPASPRAKGREAHYTNRWVHRDGSAYRHLPVYIGLHAASPTYAVSRYGPARHRTPAAAHAWVSVFRRSIRYPEGACGYGCWFYYLLPPWNRGTGMVLDVGRTLAFRNRSMVARWYRQQSESFTPPEFARCAFWSDHNGTDDMGWASKASFEGYDSLQIVDGQFGYPELIVTRAACLSRRRPLAACPPDGIVRAVPAAARVEKLRLAKTRPCICVDGAYNDSATARTYLSNCESSPTTIRRH
jgi:hypothetical protein